MPKLHCNFTFQYDPDEDDWSDLGYLQVERRSHMVVEVPGEFCSQFP